MQILQGAKICEATILANSNHVKLKHYPQPKTTTSLAIERVKSVFTGAPLRPTERLDMEVEAADVFGTNILVQSLASMADTAPLIYFAMSDNPHYDLYPCKL